MKQLLDGEAAGTCLEDIADQIAERHQSTGQLLLVGIRRGGVPLAEILARLLHRKTGRDVPVGTVDISLYRDDASTALPNPRIGPTHLPVQLDGYRVILCDDVLYTGRTIRAALDALLDYGRPSGVELCALIVRSGRELPIQADYHGREVDLSPKDRIDVVPSGDGFTAYAVPVGTPTIAPKESDRA
jgi:pyrimidine operon attenuation protein/uracil phosphoribosyltransferase